MFLTWLIKDQAEWPQNTRADLLSSRLSSDMNKLGLEIDSVSPNVTFRADKKVP